ncbi:IS701 family transposase [Streptomyces mirabilis]
MSAERVEGWAEELAALTGGLGHLFARPEPREVFADLIEGLLSDLGRKNGWTMAGRAGHATPHRIQKFLGEASWSADGLLAEVQAYAARELGDPSATLVPDDTQVIKKGDKSVGVGHQHCGTTGDVRNCQVMVMLTYAAASGHTFYDRRLYLPQSWTGDRERCRAAGVPDEVAFATKPQLGIAMLQGAVAGGLPFSWVAADADYGKDPALRSWLHRQRIRHVLAVPLTLPVQGPPGKPYLPKVAAAGDLLHYATVRKQWERRSQGEGSKGQRAYDWTWFEATLPGQIPADGFARAGHAPLSPAPRALTDARATARDRRRARHTSGPVSATAAVRASARRSGDQFGPLGLPPWPWSAPEQAAPRRSPSAARPRHRWPTGRIRRRPPPRERVQRHDLRRRIAAADRGSTCPIRTPRSAAPGPARPGLASAGRRPRAEPSRLSSPVRSPLGPSVRSRSPGPPRRYRSASRPNRVINNPRW